jgi:predicted amidohydrolase YtcJ
MAAHASGVQVLQARKIISLAGDERADALAVLGEHIVASGSRTDLLHRFPDAERVDFGDAVLVPGFNDAHMHPAQAAEDLLHVDVAASVVRSNADILAALRAAAAVTPDGGWVQASRYDDGKMAERRLLTRWDLDSAVPEHPVLVTHVAGHWAVVNSRALQLAGLDESSNAPDGGAYGRDARGLLNGVLYERALFQFRVVPPSSLEDRLIGLRRVLERFHAAGLTSLGDALVSPGEITLYQTALELGLLTARVNMLLGVEYFERLRGLGVVSGFGSSRLRINGVKAFVDGAIGGRTCLLEQPFEGTDDYGMQTTSTRELADLVRMVHTAGTRLGVHANGDRAIGLLLDQLEASAAHDPRPELHHRIEHCSVINEDILVRMRRLGAIAVPFGSYVHYHGGNLVDWYGAQRLERMFAHRSFLEAGIAVAGASDFPCGPFEPLLAMQSCVMRTGWDGTPIGISQRIAARQALELYTTGAAYASDEQTVKGRLAPGYLADFVVLGSDPLEVEPGSLADVPVRATFVGGAQVWPR